MSAYYCRHCGGPIAQPPWTSAPGIWVHRRDDGLLGSTECWPTPKAEPELA